MMPKQSQRLPKMEVQSVRRKTLQSLSGRMNLYSLFTPDILKVNNYVKNISNQSFFLRHTDSCHIYQFAYICKAVLFHLLSCQYSWMVKNSVLVTFLIGNQISRLLTRSIFSSSYLVLIGVYLNQMSLLLRDLRILPKRN